MTGRSIHIGLFPLGIVLFPGSQYPLYIFENRYKTLINEARENATEFGINLVDDGRMFPTGCLARVEQDVNTYLDGSMDIVVVGTERFQIRGYRSGEKPYLTAEADTFADDDPRPDPGHLEDTIDLYNQLVEMVYGEAEELLDATDWLSGGASYRIAQKSGLDLSVRQRLLEMRSEAERLDFLRDYLQELLPRVKELDKLQALIRNDGYLR
jgi:Lon protease-like protein